MDGITPSLVPVVRKEPEHNSGDQAGPQLFAALPEGNRRWRRFDSASCRT
jgi:hypothetical protein